MHLVKYFLIFLAIVDVTTVTSANEEVDAERVQLIVKIAEAKSAADAYRSADSVYGTGEQTDTKKQQWTETLRVSITEKTIADYEAIAARVQAIKPVEILPLLTKLRLPETITLVTNLDRAVREERRLAIADALMINDRLEQVIETIYPTRKEYFLASSMLLNKAGDYASEAISSSGEVLNMQALAMARAYAYSVREIRPRWVSFCEAQSQPVDAITERIYFIDDNSIASETGGKVEVTAADYYALASEADKTAANLPAIDAEICE